MIVESQRPGESSTESPLPRAVFLAGSSGILVGADRLRGLYETVKSSRPVGLMLEGLGPRGEEEVLLSPGGGRAETPTSRLRTEETGSRAWVSTGDLIAAAEEKLKLDKAPSIVSDIKGLLGISSSRPIHTEPTTSSTDQVGSRES